MAHRTPIFPYQSHNIIEFDKWRATRNDAFTHTRTEKKTHNFPLDRHSYSNYFHFFTAQVTLKLSPQAHKIRRMMCGSHIRWLFIILVSNNLTALIYHRWIMNILQMARQHNNVTFWRKKCKWKNVLGWCLVLYF